MALSEVLKKLEGRWRYCCCGDLRGGHLHKCLRRGSEEVVCRNLVKLFQTPPGRSLHRAYFIVSSLLSPTISAVYRRDRRDHQTLSTILLDVTKVIAARVQHCNYTSLAFGLLSSSLDLIGLPKRLQRPLCTHHRPWNPACLHGSSRSHCRVN